MNKWLKWLSQILVWLPVVGLVVWIDPILIKDIGWSNSYLPLLVGVGLASYYNLESVIKNWRQSVGTTLIVLMVLYLQILRASNWFEVGLILAWLSYLLSK